MMARSVSSYQVAASEDEAPLKHVNQFAQGVDIRPFPRLRTRLR